MTGDVTEQSPTEGLDVYVVGGAVRDELLGELPGDRDWVVVGATPEEMVRRGFVPVGGDFPVFLHPVTKEEYALARTERKSGRGYKGFVFYTGPEVTLEDDLRRRDLTVNAIARAPDGSLVDPLDGARDVRDRVLRHVGEAFVEDPVRILRLARFAARFPDFSIASETMALCRAMVHAGEADALVPERVWRELSRGLMASAPGRMLDVLDEAGALARVMPELVWNAHARRDLQAASAACLPLPGRYALLCRHSPERDALAARLRVPSECADQARLLPLVVEHAGEDTPQAVLSLIERCDALRKPERFLTLLETAQACTPIDAQAWRRRLAAARGVDAGAVARAQAGDAARIKEAVRQARLQALGEIGA